MSFRIDPAKPLGNEVQRIGTELIGDAIAALSRQPDGPHAAIHGARKTFKRLRALYLFVQNQEPEFRSTENLRFRDIAHSLSQARNAAALVETVHYLQNFARTDDERQALAQAGTALANRRDAMTGDDGDLKARIETAIADCEAGKAALCQLSLPQGRKTAVRVVRQTWCRQRKKALAALEQCHGQGHEDSFHDLRKSGQVYWMHLALLRRIWPSALRAKTIDAKRLVDLLGHEHDLSELAAFADRQPEPFSDGDTLALLLDAIIHRQQALRQECLDLATDVFAESARAESRIIAVLWNHAAR